LGPIGTHLRRCGLILAVSTATILTFAFLFSLGWVATHQLLHLARECPTYKGIGIGEAVARLPLPHHRAYGSVHGGSIGYASSLRLVKEGQAI